MSAEDDVDMNSGGFEDGPSSVLASGGEEVEEEVGEEEEEVGEEEEEEEDEGGERVGEEDDDMEEEDSGVGFQAEMMNPWDFVDDDASGAQLYKQFERIEYEALAQRKRKVDIDQSEGPAKKPRQDENAGATFEEIAEAMNYGSRRSRRRKQKKKGRRKGGKKRVNPEVSKKLGDATLHFAYGHYEEAINILNEVVLLAPVLCDPYHTLGLVYRKMGNEKKAIGCYMIAAFFSPKNTSLWKQLVNWSLEQENIGQAWYCLSKAITADPKDITLRYLRASLYVDVKDYTNAAESYNQIASLCPDDVEALKNAIKFYKESGQSERGVSLLEAYIKDHPPDSNPSMVNLVASLCIENIDSEKALAYIENAKKLHTFGERFQLSLTIKEGICHARLRNFDKAEDCFSLLQEEHTSDQIDLIISVANCFLDLEHYESALKYYLMLEGKASDEVFVCLKVAQCYLALKNTLSSIQVLYKAIKADENNIDARLTLASLLIEQQRDDEVVLLLSAPPNAGSYIETNGAGPKPWWLHWRVKLKLSHFYKDRGMLEDFVNVVFPLVRESLLYVQNRVRSKRIPRSVLSERAKILEDNSADSVFNKFRAPAEKSDRSKAARAKRALEKMATVKEERKLAALAAGLDWESDDSDEEVRQQTSKEPTFPALLEEEDQFCLIKDLCDTLTSLGRYNEAWEILGRALKLSHRILRTEKKEELRSLGAEMAFKVNDPVYTFDYIRCIVLHNPRSIAAWNCYYKLVARLENRLSKHVKFLHRMRVVRNDLVPPMIITGNQFTMISQHQVAAREYLEAYKLMPESPLVNLCAGTSLINLALGLRLQNKHQCVAQGLAFLYNNLRLCGEDNQEALYNIGRACQHVGLVSMAVAYYEKVLAIREKHYPLPEIIEKDQKIIRSSKTVYCDLRREAAFNLHLIYKSSGAVDLARQVLKDHCTF